MCSTDPSTARYFAEACVAAVREGDVHCSGTAGSGGQAPALSRGKGGGKSCTVEAESADDNATEKWQLREISTFLGNCGREAPSGREARAPRQRDESGEPLHHFGTIQGSKVRSDLKLLDWSPRSTPPSNVAQ